MSSSSSYGTRSSSSSSHGTESSSSHGTRSSSSSSLSSHGTESSSSLSTASPSSFTESQSSESSSSSGDIIREGKSSLVFQTPVKTPARAVWSAVLDLDIIDVKKMQSTAWHYIDMSGTYAGYVIKVYRIKVEDGAKLSIIITPRQLATSEATIVSAWQEVLLSRMRAALADIRAEYDASMSPGDAPIGHAL